MKTSNILIILLQLVFLNCFAQKQASNWYFGTYAGIQFNNNSVSVLTDGNIFTQEGTSAISDSSGNLLMYTDGITVWNKNHSIMPNGTGLMGHASSSQSAIIIPSPVDPDRYFYLFTIGEGTYPAPNPRNCYYSLIDLCLDNGNGDILANMKNIQIGTDLVEKMCVSRHANGIDYWIMTHKYPTNEFHAFLLTENGIEDSVVSSIGTTITDWAATFGQMKFSHDGSYLCAGSNNIQPVLDLMKFDNSTGVLYDYIDLIGPYNDQFIAYGIEFSPDNSKLYLSGRTLSGVITTSLVQYNLDDPNEDSINLSLEMIYEQTIGLWGGFGMQLAPNGKIYIPSQSSQLYLSTIENPNNLGSLCNYQENTIYLEGNQVAFTLPSFIAGLDYSNGLNNCHTSQLNEFNNIETVVQPNPFTESIQLNFPTNEFYTITIIDLNGHPCITSTSNGIEITIDTKSLSSGIYFLEMKSTTISKKLKIVKQTTSY